MHIQTWSNFMQPIVYLAKKKYRGAFELGFGSFGKSQMPNTCQLRQICSKTLLLHHQPLKTYNGIVVKPKLLYLYSITLLKPHMTTSCHNMSL